MRIQTKKIVLGTLVIVLLGAGLWLLKRPTSHTAVAATAVPVRVIQVVQQDVPRTVSGIGAVLSLHSVVIRPQI
ncbi:MAG: efflux RND transporter periplasmic adaptor subunit, partial [Pseudomonas helleri]